jgi:hypothetical protein
MARKSKLKRKRYNDTIIELHIEYDKHTYRKSLKASKPAFEVEEKTGITMIFR